MRNCPNCLAINPFKKIHEDGSVIEVCEYCNTIKEEEYDEDEYEEEEYVEYTENKAQNKEDAGSTLAFIIIFAIIGIIAYFINSIEDDMAIIIIVSIIIVVLVPLSIWAMNKEGQ